jgi:hypothetical protein
MVSATNLQAAIDSSNTVYALHQAFLLTICSLVLQLPNSRYRTPMLWMPVGQEYMPFYTWSTKESLDKGKEHDHCYMPSTPVFIALPLAE